MNEKMRTLLSGSENEWYWSIVLTLCKNGAFHKKGNFNFRNNKEYYQKHHERLNKSKRDWIEQNRERYNLNAIKRYNRRSRYLGFHKISFSIDAVPFAYHHVNINDVVAIQRDIHQRFYHRLDDGSALKLEGVLG